MKLALPHGRVDADELRPRNPDAIGRGAAMALGAHALLVIALAFGVSWKRSTPEGIEAELWAAVPQAAAPRAEPVPPTPVPAPQPKPVEKPAPVPKPAPPPPPDTREADIAREKAKKKLELEKQKAADEAERRKQAEDEKKRELAEKQKLEKAAADKQRQAEAAAAAAREKLRQDNLKRMMGAAAGTGAPDSSGTAAQSAGSTAGYAGRIKARIKPNVVFNADDVDGNPLASVEVRTAADGRIIGRKLIRSSGSPAWDEAVLRAIDKTEMLPRDTDGRVPSLLVIDFRPRDL